MAKLLSLQTSFLKKAPPVDLNRKMDALVYISVCNCNPNGDPGNNNMPRQDIETEHGLMTRCCINRQIRDTAAMIAVNEPGYAIFAKKKAVMAYQLISLADELGIEQPKPKEKKKGKKATDETEMEETKGENASIAKIKEKNVLKMQKAILDRTFDTRVFGLVANSPEASAGSLKGAFQTGMFKSLDPIMPVVDKGSPSHIHGVEEAKSNEAHQTFSDTARVPFGLYAGPIFYLPAFAAANGITAKDIELFWECVARLYEYGRSSSKGEMHVEQVILFEHDSPLGSAPSHRLFRTVKVALKDSSKPPRDTDDYAFPTEEEVQHRIDELGYKGVKVHFLL